MSRFSRRHFLCAALCGTLTLLPAFAPAQSPTTSSDSLRNFGLKPVKTQDDAPVVTSVALSPDGTLLATGGDDHLVNLWRVDDGKLIYTMRNHADWVRVVTFSPDGKILASAGDDRTIRLWDPTTGKLIRTIGRRHKNPSDESTSADRAQPEKVASSDTAATYLPDDQAAIYAIQFSPDGQSIAAAGFETAVRTYEVQSGKPARIYQCTCDDIRALAYSHDGKQLVCGGRDGSICIANVADGSVSPIRNAHGYRIRALAFSPDGDQLASAGEGGKIRIWNIATGQKQATLDQGKAKIMSLCFCGADRVASGASDNIIRVWNIGNQQIISSLTGHTGTIAALASDSAGKTLVSGSFDTTVRMWPLEGAEHPQAQRLRDEPAAR